MEFKVDVGVLNTILKTLKVTYSNKPALEILTNISIEAKEDKLIFQSSNGTTSQRFVLQSTDIKETGAICTPYDKVAKLVAALNPNVDVTFKLKTTNDKTQLIMQCNRSRYKLNTLEFENFPKLPQLDEKDNSSEKITLSTNFIQSSFKSIEPSLSDDKTDVLSNAYLYNDEDTLNLIATNRYMFTNVELPSQQLKSDFIIPGNLIKGLAKTKLNSKKTANVTIWNNANQVALNWQNALLEVTMFSVKPNKQYLSNNILKRVLDQVKNNMYTLKINRVGMLNILERLNITSGKKENTGVLSINENQFILTDMQYTGEEILSNETSAFDKSFTVGFNIDYCIDILKSYTDEYVNLMFAQNEDLYLRPVLIVGSDTRKKSILTPCRIKVEA